MFTISFTISELESHRTPSPRSAPQTFFPKQVDVPTFPTTSAIRLKTAGKPRLSGNAGSIQPPSPLISSDRALHFLNYRADVGVSKARQEGASRSRSSTTGGSLLRTKPSVWHEQASPTGRRCTASLCSASRAQEPRQPINHLLGARFAQITKHEGISLLSL